MISYEGRKYSVPPKYIGKKVDITDLLNNLMRTRLQP